MDINIREDILKRTTKCEKDFSCISSEGKGLCEAEEPTGYQVLFIIRKSNTPCIYRTPLGTSFFCCCPTRNEIYEQYKI